MPHISFKTSSVSFNLEKKTELIRLISNIFKTEDVPFKHVVFILTTDKKLLELNVKFLKHNTYTDILTFTLSSDYEPIISEIYISLDRVKYNATKYKVSFINELYRVMIHGILHLCGFSDKTLKLKTQMRAREDFYLSQICMIVSRETNDENPIS